MLTTSVFFFFKMGETTSKDGASPSNWQRLTPLHLYPFFAKVTKVGAKSWSHCPLILNSLFCKCHPTFKVILNSIVWVLFHHIFTLHKSFFFFDTHTWKKSKKFKPSVIEEHHHHHHPHFLALSQTDHRINALKCFSDYWINWPTNCPWRS